MLSVRGDRSEGSLETDEARDLHSPDALLPPGTARTAHRAPLYRRAQARRAARSSAHPRWAHDGLLQPPRTRFTAASGHGLAPSAWPVDAAVLDGEACAGTDTRVSTRSSRSATGAAATSVFSPSRSARARWAGYLC